MISEFKDYGINEGYFEEKRIRDFDDAGQDKIDFINTIAIDFDKTKDIFCGKYNQSQSGLSSCDALKFNISSDSLDLIEFKTLDASDPDVQSKVNSGWKIVKKCKDSMAILFRIVEEDDFDYHNKIDAFQNVTKNFLLGVGGSYYETDGFGRMKVALKLSILQMIVEQKLNHIFTKVSVKKLVDVDSFYA